MGTLTTEDETLLNAAAHLLATCRAAMKTQQIHLALNAIWAVVADANRYFATAAPWALKTSDPARMQTVLYVTAEVVRQVAILSQPAMPVACAKLLDLLAVPADARDFASLDQPLKPGTPLPGADGGVPALRSARGGGEGGLTAMLVDSHCHLDFPDFDADRDALVARARAAGVGTMVTISTRVKKFEALKELAQRYDHVFCSVGTHPHNAAEEPDVTTADLVRLAADPLVVAIGEAGLDYHYDNSPREAQREGFLRHIAAARETQLPLVIHARDADDDVATILEAETGKGAFPFVLHCFSSGPELARRGLALGGYVSFSGILDVQALRRIARYRDDRADGPAAGRDGRAVSRAAAASRPAQRTVVRRRDRQGAGDDHERVVRRHCQSDDREFFPSLLEGAATRNR